MNQVMPNLGLPARTPDAGDSPSRKASTVIDQGSDASVRSMPEQQMRHLLNTFDWEQGGKPLPHEEPTGDQLGALSEKLQKDTAPYTDFGLWGPYGRRQQKIMWFSAQCL